MPVPFSVEPRSGVPIYLQLIEQVKRAVALGALLPGEQLPTVKALALELTINPNTVARAYRDLERDGVISTSPGRGSFVSGDGAAPARRAVEDLVLAELDGAFREVHGLGLEVSDVRRLIDRALERWYPNGGKA